MIDINSIKSNEIREALKSKDMKKGILTIINTSTQVEEDFINELNMVLRECDDIKELSIHSISPIENIEFEQIASEKLEKLDLVCNSKIESGVFSKLIERQPNLKFLRLNGKIDDFTFLNKTNEKFECFGVESKTEVPLEYYFKYGMYKNDINVQYTDEESKILSEMQLSEHAYYWKKYYLGFENLKQNIKNYWAIRYYIENENLDMTVDDYIQISTLLNLKNMKDGVKRRIFLDEDKQINKRYLECAKEICTDENFMLALTLEQAEEYGEELGKDVNIQIYSENAEDAKKIIESQKLPKYVKEVKLELSKEQAYILANSESFRGIKTPIALKIKNASELSVDELDELSEKIEISSISMDDVNLTWQEKGEYSLADYRAARRMIDEILDGIDMSEKDDPNREKKIFGQVIKRLAEHMSYDYSALKSEDRKDWIRASNIVGGLVDGKCICAGYSEIVRNVFACIGIEARYVGGYPRKIFKNNSFEVDGKRYKNSGHAWNQIKLDGEWYNLDLTWDRDSIKSGNSTYYTLKSDKKFEHKMYKTEPEKNIVEECLVSVKTEDLNMYMYGYRHKIEELFEKSKEKIENIEDKLKSIWSIYSIGETDLQGAIKTLANDKKRTFNASKKNSHDLEK